MSARQVQVSIGANDLVFLGLAAALAVRGQPPGVPVPGAAAVLALLELGVQRGFALPDRELAGLQVTVTCDEDHVERLRAIGLPPVGAETTEELRFPDED